MKLFEIAQEIDELSGEQIYQKFYKDIPNDVFIKIVNSDPKTKWPKRVGKYSKILINLYKNDELMIEDLPKATEYLTFAYKYGIGLDINQIKTLPDIFNMVKKYIAKESNDSEVTSQSLNSDEYDVLFKGKEWTIYTPKTKKAACYLGAGTQWCTTWGKESLNPSYKDRESYFPRYNKQGPLYIIVSKIDPVVKYQFHFESSQYMDREDRSINTGQYMSDNPEVRDFFFPSFLRDVNENEREEQMEKMSVLSIHDLNILLKRCISEEELKNPLINFIINNNKDGINGIIDDESHRFQIEFENDSMKFFFFSGKDNLGDIEEVDTIIGYLEMESSNSDRVRNDMTYNEDEIKWDDILENDFKKFFEQNRKELRDSSIIDYSFFKEKYYQIFYKNEDIRKEYIDLAVEKTQPNYDSHIQAQIDTIHKKINISDDYNYFGVYLKKSGLIPFILSNEINEVNDVEEFLDDYISYHDIPTEDHEMDFYEYDREYPEYDIKSTDGYSVAIDDFFGNLFDQDKEEGEIKCDEDRIQLNRVLKKYFPNGRDYDDDRVHVELIDPRINCNDLTISIIFKNKETDEEYNGRIKAINLPNYIENYQLFEQIITFKRLI